MRDIQTEAVYKKVWEQAREALYSEVMAAIKEAKAHYGDNINCAMLHRWLKARFPFAVCWGSVEHVVTEIGGALYDKDGLMFERAALADEPHFFKKSFRWSLTNDWAVDSE